MYQKQQHLSIRVSVPVITGKPNLTNRIHFLLYFLEISLSGNRCTCFLPLTCSFSLFFILIILILEGRRERERERESDTMSYTLTTLTKKKDIDAIIKDTIDKVLVLRFGRASDAVCLHLDDLV